MYCHLLDCTILLWMILDPLKARWIPVFYSKSTIASPTNLCEDRMRASCNRVNTTESLYISTFAFILAGPLWQTPSNLWNSPDVSDS